MKRIFLIALAFSLGLLFCSEVNAQEKDNTRRVFANGTISVNTTNLCKDVDGFMGPTPIDIRIKNDTIIDIIPLSNDESPAYFRVASEILKKWIGLPARKGLELEVDAVSGATFSSEALIENVRAGIRKAIEK